MKISIYIFLVLATCWSCSDSTSPPATAEAPEISHYLPTDSSLNTHPLPDWYDDGKLGIFVCWGLYSVPAWAKGPGKTLEEILATGDGTEWFANNPYAEWYLNSLKLDGSKTQVHHRATYGGNFTYDDFIPQFNTAAANWDPQEMAALFKEVGAAYVVLVSKFHDGFVLWPSAHPNPHRDNYVAKRDIVGELSAAVREEGMKMGLYYSSGLDWTFNDRPISNFPDLFQAIPQDSAYISYLDAHWRELIDRYDPQILWADIGSPQAYDPRPLIADFYNKNPAGVVNNRHKMELTAAGFGSPLHYDFTTPEYQVLDTISNEKWETVRGIGLSFGNNQTEDINEFLSVDELVDMFVDIVSKNGNLLLNVGPNADGSIPAGQRTRLEGLGKWYRANRAAIYGTRPWTIAQASTTAGERVRFTRKGEKTYLILLDKPAKDTVVIPNIPDSAAWQSLQRVEDGKDLDFTFTNGQLSFKANFGDQPAYAFVLE
jgi:alpha-L-fucosidase